MIPLFARQRSSVQSFVRVGVVWLALTLCKVESFAQSVVVSDLRGKEAEVELVAIEADFLTLKSATATFQFKTSDIARLTFVGKQVEPPSDKALFVELVDGSRLHATNIQKSEDGWLLTRPQQEKDLLIPKELIANVQFKVLKDKASESWKALLDEEQTADILAVQRGDDLETLNGAIVGIDSETVQFELDGQLIPAPRAKVAGLIWLHRNQAPSVQAIELVSVDGSELRIKRAQWGGSSATKVVTIETMSGVSMELPIESLQRIDYSSANLKWLEEVEVIETVSLSPIASDAIAESRNKLLAPKFLSSIGNPFSSAEKDRKDLVFDGPGRFVFRAPDGYTQLVAVIQRNRTARVLAPISISIKCDGTELWKATMAGETMRLDVKATLQPNKRCEIIVQSEGALPFGTNTAFVQPHLLP